MDSLWFTPCRQHNLSSRTGTEREGELGSWVTDGRQLARPCRNLILPISRTVYQIHTWFNEYIHVFVTKYNFIFNENIIFNNVGLFILEKLHLKVRFSNTKLRSNLTDLLNRNDTRHMLLRQSTAVCLWHAFKEETRLLTFSAQLTNLCSLLECCNFKVNQ